MCKKFFIFFSIILFILVVPTSGFSDDLLIDDYLEFENNYLFNVSAPIDGIPDINARRAIVIDRCSNQILFGKNETEKCKMASTTKIMTCLIVLENSSLEDIVKISLKAASTGGSRLGLSTNDTITVKDLLYGLMLCSGNDAAVALAEYISGSVEDFSKLMNEKALNLGLSSTHFVTPHGLDDDGHYTTAYDLAILTNYALKNSIFSKIVSTKNYTIKINGYLKNISNTNELLNSFDGVYGVKTGFTNGANRCLVTACKRGNLDIICVVLGCDTKKDRTQDSIKLIDYAFKNFTLVNIENILDKDFESWYLLHANSFTINKGISQILNLRLDKSALPYSYIAIKNSNITKIESKISFSSYIEAPVFSGTKIGNLSLAIDGRELFTLDITNSNKIPKKNIMFYFPYFLSILNKQI